MITLTIELWKFICHFLWIFTCHLHLFDDAPVESKIISAEALFDELFERGLEFIDIMHYVSVK